MLVRTQLRNLVRQALLDATDAGASVYDTTLEVRDEWLPLINIFTPSELIQDGLLVITLEVTAVVMADDGVQSGLLVDTLCEQVRTALRNFWNASSVFTASYLGTDLSFDIDGAQPYAAGKLTYQVETLNE
jgi:hypothetical protein